MLDKQEALSKPNLLFVRLLNFEEHKLENKKGLLVFLRQPNAEHEQDGYASNQLNAG